MKQFIIPAVAALVPVIGMAQSPVEAAALSQTEMRGTARFMGMGGAFTALGADPSAMNQNPAGIGVYTRSDLGITLDINTRSYNMPGMKNAPAGIDLRNEKATNVSVPNLTYVGAINLDGTLRTFNWGVSYGRVSSFDRVVKGYNDPTQTSLSNYIASFSGGYKPETLGFGKDYNPYADSNADWLSILAYNTYMINPTSGAGDQYAGLHTQGTQGDAAYTMRENGYVDEYNIDLGGNVDDVVYWGLGVGITDLYYHRTLDYSESMANADVVSGDQIVSGNAGITMGSTQSIWGSGANIKLGVILRPTSQLRFGLAVHTPTWYTLNHESRAGVNYSYYNPVLPEGNDNPLAGSEDTDRAYFSTRLNTPWRVMGGVAGVIGNRLILSADYECRFYKGMSTSTESWDQFGYYEGFQPDKASNAAVGDYYKNENIVRLGAEFRATPQLSLRAGYAYEAGNTTKQALDGEYNVLTTGVDPSFSFNKSTNYITAGVGYRYQAWYIDAAYVHKVRNGEFHAYADFNGFKAPSAATKQVDNSLVLSTGFKF